MPNSAPNQKINQLAFKRVKVFGAGGAGINLIENMMKHPAPATEFIAVHGSAQALAQSSAHKRFLLGRTGRPQARASEARRAAEFVMADLQALMLGADLVMIVAAMGGATGSGVSLVIARIARSLQIHSVAVVAKPFEWETTIRSVVANESADQLACCADSVIEVSNQSAGEMLWGEEIEYERGIVVVNEAIGGIGAEVVRIVGTAANAPGDDSKFCPNIASMSLDAFRTVMRAPCRALVGMGMGIGPGRARMALQQALCCPLLEGMEVSAAKSILVSITTAGTLRKEEAQSIVTIARAAAGDADLKFCTSIDPSCGERLQVTVFGVGLHRAWDKPSSAWMERHHMARRLPDAPSAP